MTTSMVVADGDALAPVRAELAHEGNRAQQALAQLRAFEITDDDALAFAGDILKSIKQQWKDLEAKRTSVTAPLHQAFTAACDLFRPVQQPLKEAEAELKKKIGAYTLAQQAAQQAAMQSAAAAIQAGDPAAAQHHVDALAPVASVAGVRVKTVWRWRVVDEAAVPVQFKSVDAQKIDAAIWYADTPHKAPLAIPGIEFFLDGQVTVRG